MSDERLPELYERAAALDAGDRERLLDELRRDDPALAAELERLVATPAAERSPIDERPWRGRGNSGEVAVEPPVPPRIGRFEIRRELGRGGMGRVFLAEERTDVFERTVALKIVHDPGTGAGAVRRFRDEVRILASLEHPGIARFLDGGRSAEGVWYLALEYVDGVDLLEHARRAELGVRERLELFTAVLEAVAYAHARGVVHRDLKPSNVLVGSDGRPRLLDFGISKLVDGDGVTQTLTGLQPLTPAYASPEQRRGEPATPRSDVYSLGIVLHELLVGRRPATTAGVPETPSAAARRAGRPGTIDRALDAVCLKALSEDASLRYETAAELLDDLRRHLDGRPVSARPAPSFRRRAAAMAAALAVVLAAALATVAFLSERDGSGDHSPADRSPTTIFPFDPSDPPPAAESERRLADAPDDFVAGSALALRLARDGRGDEALLVVGRLRQVPGGDREPLVDYAEGRLASLRGEDQLALVFYTRARDRALEAGRSELYGTIRTSRAATLSKLGHRDASVAELEQARRDSERAGDSRTLYRTLNGLALEYLQRGEMDRGQAALDAALVAAAEAGVEPIVTLENLAAVHAIRGRPDLGEPIERRLVEHFRRAGRPYDEGEASKTLALLLRDLGRRDEATAALDHGIELLRDSPYGNVLADALHARGVAALEDGPLGALDGVVVELEETGRRSLKRLPLGYARWLVARKAALIGDLARAREEFAEARRLLAAGGDRDLAALADLDWAEAEAAAGDPAAAEQRIGEALTMVAQSSGSQAGWFADALRARLAAGAGRLEEAAARLAALGADSESSPALPRRLAYLATRAAVARASGRAGDARRDLETALGLARASGRRHAALELRFELASSMPNPAAARNAAAEIAHAAEAAGLTALAGRARAAATPPVGR